MSRHPAHTPPECPAEVTCIICPLGCLITVTQEEDSLKTTGQGCLRGETYALDEYRDPRRILTTTALVQGGTAPLVAVRSTTPVPKALQQDLVREISSQVFSAPIHEGDILIAKPLGLELEIIATAEVPPH
jgi:CxxC motif-containing protein